MTMGNQLIVSNARIIVWLAIQVDVFNVLEIEFIHQFVNVQMDIMKHSLIIVNNVQWNAKTVQEVHYYVWPVLALEKIRQSVGALVDILKILMKNANNAIQLAKIVISLDAYLVLQIE